MRRYITMVGILLAAIVAIRSASSGDALWHGREPRVKTSTDYLAQLNALKTGYLDGLWSSANGRYEDAGSPWTWLNAYMVHVTAILAGRDAASSIDIARAVTVIGKLTSPPCYASYTWNHSLTGGSDTHPALDTAVAEALFFAWQYRTQLGLSGPTVSAIFDILTVNRAVPSGFEMPDGNLDPTDTWNNQDLAKWQLNRLRYSHMAGVSRTTELSTASKRFIAYMNQGAPLSNSTKLSFLFPDFGWRYIDEMTWQSWEYGEMTLGAFLLYYPDVGTAMSLTSGEIDKVKAWQHAMLTQWQRNGYGNWDTGWSDDRIHTHSYWVWSLRALMGMVRGSALNQGTNDALAAKWLLDNALDMQERMDTWNSDPADHAVAEFPYNTSTTALGAYNFSKGNSNARFAMELAMCVELGIADAPSQDPGNIWGWGWAQKHLHISTPFYDAASLPSAPILNGTWGEDAVQSQHWGIARIGRPTGEILTSLGGYGLESFSFQVSRSGVTDIDTSDGATEPTTLQVYRDGVLQTRVDYDTSAIPLSFDSNVHQVAKRTGTNYRAEVETIFRSNMMTSVHRAVLTGATGPAQVVMSVPARKNVVIDYVAVGGAKTVVWNGIVVTPAGSPAPSACKYIHMHWPAKGVGIILIPRSATVGTGAKVTALNYDPNGYPHRQPDQDRSLLIYLSDTTVSNVDSVDITHDYKLTDGTDAGAESVFAAKSTASLPNSLTYTPGVVSVSPATAPLEGTVSITITGVGFTGATGVTIGSIAATDLVVVNDTTITCTVPAHAAGSVDVVVTVAGIQGTLVSGVTYQVWSTTLIISGTARNGAQVEVEFDGVSQTVTSDGTWSAQVEAGLGQHTIRARQTAAGRTSEWSNTVHVTGVAGRAPTIIIEPEDGFTVTVASEAPPPE